MRRSLPTLRNRHRHRPATPAGSPPPPDLQGRPAHILALRAGDLASGSPAPEQAAVAAATEATRQQVVERARRSLEDGWASGAPLAELERDLRHAGLPERTTSLLLAERRAVDRIRAAGLDPSIVRSDVDAMLALDPWTTTTTLTTTTPRART